jgi:hypothetical protein
VDDVLVLGQRVTVGFIVVDAEGLDVIKALADTVSDTVSSGV